MARSLVLFAVVLLLVVSENHGCSRSQESSSDCGLVNPRDVTLRAVNVLRAPPFDVRVTITRTRLPTLFQIMQQGADASKLFRFNTKYFDAKLGFLITAINNVFGDFALDKSYWQIFDGVMKPIKVGASFYKPTAGETVTFNLTQSGHLSDLQL